MATTPIGSPLCTCRPCVTNRENTTALYTEEVQPCAKKPIPDTAALRVLQTELALWEKHKTKANEEYLHAMRTYDRTVRTVRELKDAIRKLS